MHRSLRLFAILALGLSLSAGSAMGALTTDQFRCQNIAAKQGRKLFKKTFKFLAKCHDNISKGKLPFGTDCTVEAFTAGKIADAEAKFQQKVEKRCSDSVVASLDFGGQCFGVTTQADLVACSIEEHNQSARSLIDIVYVDSPTPLDRDQRKCQKRIGKTVLKQANKRMALLQRCKKLVAKDKNTADTDCVKDAEDKLTRLLAKSVDKIAKGCSDLVTSTLEFGGVCEGQTEASAVTACSLCLDDRQTDDLVLVQYGSSPYGATAQVEQISDTADCVKGPLSRCRAGDYLLSNDKIRVVVQDVPADTPVVGTTGRNLFGIGQFGGQIIDADLVRQGGDPDRDNFEEWSVSLNLENTAHYTDLQIINDGSNGGPAVLRTTGVDDLLDFLNPSSVIAGFGLNFPADADDKDLPVTVMTDYILEPGKNYVRVETTVQNMSGADLGIYFGEFIGGSGQVEFFQPGYGFGEPLVTLRCPTTPNNECNFQAWSGEDDADGVSYGYVHEVPGSSTFTTSGVTVPQLGASILSALLGPTTPPFTMAPLNDPGDSLTFTRYFVVGDGTVSAITDARNEIECLAIGVLEGTVTADGNPVQGADVAVLGNVADGPGQVAPLLAPLSRNVITHTRTDADGKYRLTLPVGDYDVVGNLDGHPYEGGGSSPMLQPVTITAFQTVQQNVAIPATGSLQVTVVDGNSDDIAAKVSVVGFDPSEDPFNLQDLLLIKNTTAVFGERAEDGLPYGVARAIFIDQNGDSGTIPLEPADYQVVVSHGPEYSISQSNISSAMVSAGATVNATVERVVDSTGFVAGDFHVHSINSPDAEVSHVERIISMLAEGVDLFTPTDHDILSDFSDALTTTGAAGLITIATGEEITTFDYGHFNAWPLAIDPAQPNGGAVDHGGAAPDGEDFPVAPYFNYSETPADIIALARTMPQPGASTVQINHIHSHFGLDGGSGLAIDTGVEPPQSAVPAAARRLDPSVTNFFTDTFDALEIWIGDNRDQIYNLFLGETTNSHGANIADWFNLINQGIVRTGVADSDTHRRIITQSGFPRTMVASPEDDPGLLGSLVPTLSSNVNAGRTIGTNGPLVRVTAYASSTGESGGLEVGRCTGVVPCTDTSDCPPCTDDAQCSIGESCTVLPTLISTTDGNVDVTVDVQSPAWAEFDTIEFYVNTTTTQRTLTNQETGAGTIDVKRYSITPDFVHTDGAEFTLTPVAVGGATRLEASTTLSLTGLTEDTWVAVLVRGTDGTSAPMFPVVPNDIDHEMGNNDTLAELTDGNLGEKGITALAFTNPVFIDVDNGTWTAPGVQVAP